MNVKIIVLIVSGSIFLLSSIFTGLYFLINNNIKLNQSLINKNTSISLPLFDDKIDNSKYSCGKSTLQTDRIINGYLAKSNSWPWMASLRTYSKSSNTFSTHFCGGALIDSYTILTAAHCVNDQKPDKLGVYLGINSLKESVNKTNTYLVSKLVYHSEYDSKLIINDIALLKLSREVRFNSKIYPICLPFNMSGSTLYEKDLTLIGWGSIDGTRFQSSQAIDLQETKLKIINGNYICSIYVTYNPDKIYCAIDEVYSSQSNACFGDSGGPLMYSINETWYTFGIVSFVLSNSMGNCNPTSPSYYTQVTAYLDWISDNLKKL